VSPDASPEPLAARRLWTLFEPIHGIAYFAPEPAEEYRNAGLRGRWMGYFASRSAAMGPVGPDVVIATFFTFGPSVVRRAIPDAWGFAGPERVLAARLAGVDAALRRRWGARVEAAETRAAAELALRVALQADISGRPITAAQRALPVPDPAHLALWHACTLLREHRYEGHRAALIVAGLDGCEAQVTAAAAEHLDPEFIRGFRGWSDAEWATAEARLRRRGVLDGGGDLTVMGRALRDEVEAVTDRLAAGPWRALDEPERDALAQLLLPLAQAVYGEGGIPEIHPTGVPRPS
jgi:hypothetical protein